MRLQRSLIICLIGALLSFQSASALEIFSSGMQTPETISQVPSGFGNYGGSYFIPDPGFNFSANPNDRNIWVVQGTGGSPALFVNNPDSWLVGGLFLPGSSNYLTVGWLTTTNATGKIYTYDSSGNKTLRFEGLGQKFTTPVIAPSTFGGYGGKLFVTDQESHTVDIFDPSAWGSPTVFATTNFRTFGLAFAPPEFGNFSGQLFVNSGALGEIVAIDSNGNITHFATIDLLGGQRGLRQMEFSPPEFIPGYDELLFVSVSGSQAGGGSLGDLLGLDSSGNIVVSLRVSGNLNKFDPRGLFFTDDGNLLISDASDPIIIASAQDFQPGRPVPEPATMLLLGSGLIGLFGYGRKKFFKK